jgi:hypothetical protein
METSRRAGRIEGLRHALLELHKAMLDAQRIRYERTHGRIESSGKFLQLVVQDPAFEWIRALSALIAQLDQWADDSETASDQQLSSILEALRALIRPEGKNADFTRRYWEMIEDDPDVTVGHVKVWRLLDPSPPPPPESRVER